MKQTNEKKNTKQNKETNHNKTVLLKCQYSSEKAEQAEMLTCNLTQGGGHFDKDGGFIFQRSIAITQVQAYSTNWFIKYSK